MVHNGIEYGDMQLIAETYDLLHARRSACRRRSCTTIFAEWNAGELQSYLIEITADDPRAGSTRRPGRPLVDLILDEAQQKGTGKWTSQNALDVGAPIPTINAAVESRILSALKAERVAREPRPARAVAARITGDRQRLIDAARDALYASKITSYAQGLRPAAHRVGGVRLRPRSPASIARIWRAGCIIRAALLGDIMAAYRARPGAAEPAARRRRSATPSSARQGAWRFVVQTAVGLGIPVLAMSASLAYFDAYRSERLPANLTQAQRDYFGAHTYRRVDKPGVFHTEW